MRESDTKMEGQKLTDISISVNLFFCLFEMTTMGLLNHEIFFLFECYKIEVLCRIICSLNIRYQHINQNDIENFITLLFISRCSFVVMIISSRLEKYKIENKNLL